MLQSAFRKTVAPRYCDAQLYEHLDYVNSHIQVDQNSLASDAVD
jgi:hypothetical protein